MLDITPLFLAVASLFALTLIFLKVWYLEDVGLAMLGFVFMIGATLKNLTALSYLGGFFILLGIALGIVNIFAKFGSTLTGGKFHVDFFNRFR